MLTNLEVYSALSTAPDLPLELGVGADDDPIHIRDIQGLGPVKADVSTTQFATQDGATLSGTSIGMRNIVIVLGFNPDWSTNTMSSLRQMVYSYFMSKQEVRLRFFRDDAPACEISGICESADPSIFAQDPEMTISVLCPDPDFVAVGVSTVDGVANHTPASVDFTLVGNKATSGRLVVTASAGTPTYDGGITLEHRTLAPDPNNFTITGSIDPVEQLIIDSARGAKVAKNVVGGTDINLLNTMTDDSVWLALQPGTNKIKVILDAAAPDHPWELTYYERFGAL